MPTPRPAGIGWHLPPSIPTDVQPSLISFAIKAGAKRVSKNTLKSFIKTRINDRLGKLTNKKLAKEFAEEADQILGMLQDPWWSTAIGFIPIVGDAFDLVRVPSQIRMAVSRADALEDKVQAALVAEHKAHQAAQAASSAARHVPAPAVRSLPGPVTRSGGSNATAARRTTAPTGGNARQPMGAGRTTPLTRSEARETAGRLGYREVKGPPFDSHGQPVFQKGDRFISPDRDVHRGGELEDG